MKRISFNYIIAGMFVYSAFLGITSCSDDHYDIKTGVESSGNTIWQNIEANPQLDSLAMILKRVKVYSKEEDKTRTMTYAEYLNSAQTLTLWAPIDGSYNASSYLSQLDQVDALNAEGKSTEANKLEYTIGNQFAQNHLARFNYESDKTSQEVHLLNGKITTYNASEGTFNGVKLNSTYANVPSSNGVMHVIEGKSAFSYNIFDYFEAYSDIFSNIYGTLSDPEIDKKTFSESASIAGALNEDGEMVYVDSVYISDNEMLNESNAQIKDEDSLYIALAPTDAAWEEAVSKVGKLFKYKTTYRYNYKNSTTEFSDTLKLNASWNGHSGETLADSLADYNTKKALLTSMYFSPSIFSQDFERDDIDGILNYAYYADSLISTNGVVYYNSTPGAKNPMFGDVDPVMASNGVIFPLTSYTIDPTYSFMTRQQIDMTNYYNVGATSNCSNASTRGTVITLVAGTNFNEEVDISALNDDQQYRYFEATGSGNFDIYIPVPNLYSGNYSIKLQMVPNRACTDYMWLDDDSGEEVMQNIQFTASLLQDNGTNIGSETDEITVDDGGVRTYTLWDSIEIPNCYVDLPAGVESCYPLLRLRISRRLYNSLKPKNVSSYSIGLSIANVIVEPVHE